MNNKFKLIDTENFKIFCSFDASDNLFIHADVEKWSPSLYKEACELWGDLLVEIAKACRKDIFSYIPKGDKKLFKFQLVGGMEPFMETEEGIIFKQELDKWV